MHRQVVFPQLLLLLPCPWLEAPRKRSCTVGIKCPLFCLLMHTDSSSRDWSREWCDLRELASWRPRLNRASSEACKCPDCHFSLFLSHFTEKRKTLPKRKKKKTFLSQPQSESRNRGGVKVAFIIAGRWRWWGDELKRTRQPPPQKL